MEDVCAELQSDVEFEVTRLARQARRDGDSQEEFEASVLEATPGLAEPAYDRIDALEPPEGHAEQAREFVATLRATGPLYERAAAAVRAGDSERLERLDRELLDAALPTRELARELDIEACIPADSR